ncbi:MAG: sirohydrochlorin chelatase [Hyphomicrobiales bacterium]|nr:MAG: sirohydrochlorin chelatase [Hyphomicrobiales bacterium]
MTKETSEKIGVMVCGHGSRNRNAVGQFSVLAERLRPHFPDWPVEYGYLEFANPIFGDGLDKLRDAGCNRILAVPGMLFAGGHAKNDIPSVLNTYQAQNPGVRIEYGRELGIDPKMLKAAAIRIQEAIDSSDQETANHDTVLVVVGRGASDPDANANIAKVMRLLWEGFGFGWGEVAYSGVTFPLVEPALDNISKMGFKRVIVFPYFLFTGVLVRRIYDSADVVAAKHLETEFINAPFLNDHDLVIETFADRVREIISGENLMNCQMCKYRTQILGFEDQVGLPQESHHHHVEGKNEPCTLCDDSGECTGKCEKEIRAGMAHDHHAHDHTHDHSHDDGHHHHPYPHADHPMGPKTLLED